MQRLHACRRPFAAACRGTRARVSGGQACQAPAPREDSCERRADAGTRTPDPIITRSARPVPVGARESRRAHGHDVPDLDGNWRATPRTASPLPERFHSEPPSPPSPCPPLPGTSSPSTPGGARLSGRRLRRGHVPGGSAVDGRGSTRARLGASRCQPWRSASARAAKLARFPEPPFGSEDRLFAFTGLGR